MRHLTTRTAVVAVAAAVGLGIAATPASATDLAVTASPPDPIGVPLPLPLPPTPLDPLLEDLPSITQHPDAPWCFTVTAEPLVRSTVCPPIKP